MLPPETWNWNLGTLEPPQSSRPRRGIAVEPRTRNLRVATESAAYTLRNLALSASLLPRSSGDTYRGRARRLALAGGKHDERARFHDSFNTNLNIAPHDFPGPYAHWCAGPAMPSFWSFFGFVGSLHLSSARVRTSGRDLLLPLRCSPRFYILWAGPSGRHIPLARSARRSYSSLLDELELRVVRVG